MRYNVFIAGGNGNFSLLDLEEKQLQIVVESYFKGKPKFALAGKTYYPTHIHELKIYLNESGRSAKELQDVMEENATGAGIFSGVHYTAEDLSDLGIDLTEQWIGDAIFGDHVQQQQVNASNLLFINQERIEELEALNANSRFDLRKLIQMCKEINDNYQRQNYYSVSLLLRTILNHIPPAFNNKENFDQVLAELNGVKHKAKRELFTRLQELQRKLADQTAHEPLRNHEPAMTAQEVHFIPEIDFLLKEACVALK